MKTLAAFAIATLAFCASAFAQAPQANPTAVLVVTVVDTTGAVLPGATVTITGLDPANQATPIAPVRASDQGGPLAPKLAPGRYTVKAEAAGFEASTIPEVRVRNGNNKQVVMLPIEGHNENVQVTQDKTAAA